MKYTRIDIKSADDLPKVNGEYFAHRIDYNEITFRTFKIGEPKLHYNHAYYLNFWLKNIDWYLLIEDTEPSYPEEFVEWFGKQCEYIPDEDGNALYRSNHFNKYNSRHLTLEEVYQFWNDNIKDK